MLWTKELKEKAVNRMKLMDLYPQVIKEFKSEETVLNYSESFGGGFDGILYWVSNERKYVEAVKTFEAEHDGLKVYHAILSHTDIGDLFTMLFVSEKDDSDKAFEREFKKNGYVFAAVLNLDEPSICDLGTVVLKPVNGGLKRVG